MLDDIQLTLRIFRHSSFMAFLDKLQLPLIGCDYIMLFHTMTANLFKLKRKFKLYSEELSFVLTVLLSSLGCNSLWNPS